VGEVNAGKAALKGETAGSFPLPRDGNDPAELLFRNRGISMRNLLRAAAITAFCAATLTTTQVVAGATTADESAVLGGCSSFPPTPCGEVQNNSVRTVRVSLNWTCSADTAPIGSSCPQSITTVAPHSHIGGGNVDVDAFEVPRGCSFAFDIDGLDLTRGAGWYKFSSLNTVTIHSATCGVGS
jgi:hypothetical protein